VGKKSHLSLKRYQVIGEKKDKFQLELGALKFANVKIKLVILELSDFVDEDV
jgi:hypothetical protein